MTDMREISFLETNHLQVDPFHTDFKYQLQLETLGVDLLNVAERHAKNRGFGMTAVNNTNYTWVLSRLVIELDKTPKLGEHYDVSTWIESVFRFFTGRNFSIVNADNDEPFGYAKSVWAMINMDTRQPADLHEMFGDRLERFTTDRWECPIDKLKRVMPIADDKLQYQRPVVYTDIDMNGHVNSMKYIQHIRDLFPLDYYRANHMRRMELAYMMESHIGDQLSFFVENPEERTFLVEVRKNFVPGQQKGEVVARSRVIFD